MKAHGSELAFWLIVGGNSASCCPLPPLVKADPPTRDPTATHPQPLQLVRIPLDVCVGGLAVRSLPILGLRREGAQPSASTWGAD